MYKCTVNGKVFEDIIRLDDPNLKDIRNSLKQELFTEFDVQDNPTAEDLFDVVWRNTHTYYNTLRSMKSVSEIYDSFRDFVKFIG